MYTRIDIGKYISNYENINTIELYIINSNTENTINVMISDRIDKLVDNIYKKSRTEKYKSYFNKERVYTYELSNDNQYVYTKIKKELDIRTTEASLFQIFNKSFNVFGILNGKVKKELNISG
jgi:macrodomain Ter protein organizer (MatP/YcbG family)